MPKVSNCPHCESALVPHGGVNEGFAHCNACGCCFVEDTGALRPGSQICNPQAAELMAKSAVSTDEVKELQQRISELELEVKAKEEDIEKITQEGVVAAAKVTADADEAMKALKKEHDDEVKALKAEHEAAMKAATATPKPPAGNNT